MQVKIAVYSEKGGVGKTTILSSIAYKITDISQCVFLDADSSSQSLSDVLKFYDLQPKMVYRDSICVLPFLTEIHKNTEHFFIDLAGREATASEIDYFKYLDLVIVPVPPIYSNYSTPVHTVEKLIKHGVPNNKILVTINYMWSNENLDNAMMNEFNECVQIMYQKHGVNLYKPGISFSSSLNKNKNCLKNNSRYINDIIKLSELIKSIIKNK